jgi:hypothetical protein
MVPTLSNLEAIAFSYGGGTNGNGTMVAEGGFEPYLNLFDSAGDFLASTFFGTTCPPGAIRTRGVISVSTVEEIK